MSCKGHDIILFYGCMVFIGVHVPQFFTQSINDGHLGWFHVFALVNNAAVNICVYFYNRVLYIPLGIYPVMGLLGQMAFLVLGLWGIATLPSTVAALICISTNSVKLFFFSTASPASVVSGFFNDRHSNLHEMVSWYGFDLHFSDDQWWAFFHMFVGFINIFFWKVK